MEAIDYSRSIQLIDPAHVEQLKLQRDKREAAAKALENKRAENQHQKEERAAAKQVKATL
jgi:hypothetical protein